MFDLHALEGMAMGRQKTDLHGPVARMEVGMDRERLLVGLKEIIKKAGTGPTWASTILLFLALAADLHLYQAGKLFEMVALFFVIMLVMAVVEVALLGE